MNTRIFSTVLMAVLHGSACAQNALEPCDVPFSNPYHAGVNKVISGAVAQQARVQLVTLPSFEPESALKLVGSEIYFVGFQSSFWAGSYRVDRHGTGRMDFTKPQIRTRVRHAPISAAVADRVEQLYVTAIAGAKTSNQMGLDGVDYIFSTAGGACGRGWSPAPGSRNHLLIQVMRHLEKHTALSRSADLQRSEKALVQLLQAIERD